MKLTRSGLLSLVALACFTSSACHHTLELPEPQVKQPSPTTPGVSLGSGDRDRYTNALISRREDIKRWALTCDGIPSQGHSYSNWISESPVSCYQGDMNERAGMLCLSATLANDFETAAARCHDVQIAQIKPGDPRLAGLNDHFKNEIGRWFRGPQRIQSENDSCNANVIDPSTKRVECPETNAFSRDSLNGLIGYWIATKDSDSATNWLAWVRQHSGKMCDVAVDNRCFIMGGNWGQLDQVWKLLGLAPTSEMSSNDLTYMEELSVSNVPIGFELELKVTEVWYLRILNQFSSDRAAGDLQKKILNDTAKKAYNLQPLNPYFDFIANGVTSPMIDRLLSYCPANRPAYDNMIYGDTPEPYQNQGKAADWTWQRNTDYQVWNMSMGHDCIFLINAILAEMK